MSAMNGNFKHEDDIIEGSRISRTFRSRALLDVNSSNICCPIITIKDDDANGSDVIEKHKDIPPMSSTRGVRIMSMLSLVDVAPYTLPRLQKPPPSDIVVQQMSPDVVMVGQKSPGRPTSASSTVVDANVTDQSGSSVGKSRRIKRVALRLMPTRRCSLKPASPIVKPKGSVKPAIKPNDDPIVIKIKPPSLSVRPKRSVKPSAKLSEAFCHISAKTYDAPIDVIKMKLPRSSVKPRGSVKPLKMNLVDMHKEVKVIPQTPRSIRTIPKVDAPAAKVSRVSVKPSAPIVKVIANRSVSSTASCSVCNCSYQCNDEMMLSLCKGCRCSLKSTKTKPKTCQKKSACNLDRSAQPSRVICASCRHGKYRQLRAAIDCGVAGTGASALAATTAIRSEEDSQENQDSLSSVEQTFRSLVDSTLASLADGKKRPFIREMTVALMDSLERQ